MGTSSSRSSRDSSLLNISRANPTDSTVKTPAFNIKNSPKPPSERQKMDSIESTGNILDPDVSSHDQKLLTKHVDKAEKLKQNVSVGATNGSNVNFENSNRNINPKTTTTTATPKAKDNSNVFDSASESVYPPFSAKEKKKQCDMSQGQPARVVSRATELKEYAVCSSDLSSYKPRSFPVTPSQKVQKVDNNNNNNINKNPSDSDMSFLPKRILPEESETGSITFVKSLADNNNNMGSSRIEKNCEKCNLNQPFQSLKTSQSLPESQLEKKYYINYPSRARPNTVSASDMYRNPESIKSEQNCTENAFIPRRHSLTYQESKDCSPPSPSEADLNASLSTLARKHYTPNTSTSGESHGYKMSGAISNPSSGTVTPSKAIMHNPMVSFGLYTTSEMIRQKQVADKLTTYKQKKATRHARNRSKNVQHHHPDSQGSSSNTSEKESEKSSDGHRSVLSKESDLFESADLNDVTAHSVLSSSQYSSSGSDNYQDCEQDGDQYDVDDPDVDESYIVTNLKNYSKNGPKDEMVMSLDEDQQTMRSNDDENETDEYYEIVHGINDRENLRSSSSANTMKHSGTGFKKEKRRKNKYFQNDELLMVDSEISFNKLAKDSVLYKIQQESFPAQQSRKSASLQRKRKMSKSHRQNDHKGYSLKSEYSSSPRSLGSFSLQSPSSLSSSSSLESNEKPGITKRRYNANYLVSDKNNGKKSVAANNNNNGEGDGGKGPFSNVDLTTVSIAAGLSLVAGLSFSAGYALGKRSLIRFPVTE